MDKDTIIFDLDGTLLNTLEDLHACFNYAIELCGYPKRSLSEIRNFVGNGIKKAIERALPKGTSEEEIDKVIVTFKKYYQEHMTEYTKPYNGIIELLEELKEKGYKIGVVSNKYDKAVKALCKDYFGDLVQTAIGESKEIEKKPNPNGVLKAIKEVNSTVERTIYVGDSEVDIQTAKNANVPCISVLWGFKDKEFLEANGGYIFAKVPEDIIKIIEKKSYLI